MSEEEIIEILTDIINDEASIIDEIGYKAIQGLLDLYTKEQGKNKKIEAKIKEIIDKIDAEDYYCLNEAEEDLRKLVE